MWQRTQYSCQENATHRGTWCAGVTKSQTQLKGLSICTHKSTGKKASDLMPSILFSMFLLTEKEKEITKLLKMNFPSPGGTLAYH